MDKARKVYEDLVKNAGVGQTLLTAGKHLIRSAKEKGLDLAAKVIEKGPKGTAKALVTNKKVQVGAASGAGGFVTGRASKKD